jgi:signal peptidase II
MSEQVETLDAEGVRPAVTGLGIMAFAIAAVVVVLDQISKYWILQIVHLPDRAPIRVLPFFQLTMVWNQGVSFGLLRADTLVGRWLLVLFALAVVAALAAWARNVRRPLTGVALGLVMGGALGNNLIDRVRFGAVADFLDFRELMFPWIFNVADSAISVGVALLLLDIFLQPKTHATA